MTGANVLAALDREAFERASAALGGPAPAVLDGFLGSGMHPDAIEPVPDVRRWGIQELGWLIRCLHPAGRLALLRRIPPGDRWQVVRTPGACPGARFIESLQDVLVHPGLGDLDLVGRAGLHRVARKLAEAGPARVRAAARTLSPLWRGCLLTIGARFTGRTIADGGPS